MKKSRVQITPDMVSEKAFRVYSDDSLSYEVDTQGTYYIDGDCIGSLAELNNYLEDVYDMMYEPESRAAWEVAVETVEVRNISRSEVEALKKDTVALGELVNDLILVADDCISKYAVFDSIDEARAYFNKLAKSETARYYEGNKLLQAKRVRMEHIEVDSEGGYIDSLSTFNEGLEYGYPEIIG